MNGRKESEGSELEKDRTGMNGERSEWRRERGEAINSGRQLHEGNQKLILMVLQMCCASTTIPKTQRLASVKNEILIKSIANLKSSKLILVSIFQVKVSNISHIVKE